MLFIQLKKQRTNPLDCQKYEIGMSSPNDVKNILKSLGFELVVKIEKLRKSATYKGINFCLDDVLGLGVFLETEIVIEDGDGASIQNQLIEFIENSIGISNYERVSEGYDTLMYRKNTLTKKRVPLQ